MDYFRIRIASASPKEAPKHLSDLLNTTEQKLPKHDSEQELLYRFIKFFHSRMANTRTTLDKL